MTTPIRLGQCTHRQGHPIDTSQLLETDLRAGPRVFPL